MGGRVAEEIIFNVQNNWSIKRLWTSLQMARAMVTEYGMSESQFRSCEAMFGAQTQ